MSNLLLLSTFFLLSKTFLKCHHCSIIPYWFVCYIASNYLCDTLEAHNTSSASNYYCTLNLKQEI